MPGNPDIPGSARRVVRVLGLWEAYSGPLPPCSPSPCRCDCVPGSTCLEAPGREPGTRDHRPCLAPRGTRCCELRSGAAFSFASAPGWSSGLVPGSTYCSNLLETTDAGTAARLGVGSRWALCPPLPNASCHPQNGEMLLARTRGFFQPCSRAGQAVVGLSLPEPLFSPIEKLG